jgi:hypothetical protein
LRRTIILDLGETGTKADAFVIWVCQFVGREIRVLNYDEAVGPAAIGTSFKAEVLPWHALSL